ncbi:ATP-binding protein [Methylocella sp.]|uniref:sensor histidine kinase n=1 Tax=Methylocella sp. TaxID=1978226 RepID=UPI00378454CF
MAAAFVAVGLLGLAQAYYGSRAIDAAAALMSRAEMSNRQLGLYQQLSIEAAHFVLAGDAGDARDASARALGEGLAGLERLAALEQGLLEAEGQSESPDERARLARISEATRTLVAGAAASARRTYEAELKPLLATAVAKERKEAERTGDAMRERQARMRWLSRVGAATQAATLAFVFWLVTRSLFNPLWRLASDIREFGRGRLSHRVAARGHDEFTLFAQSVNRMACNLDRKRRRLVEINESLEEIVAERTRLLEQRNQALKDVDESRRRFFADVSHELRTPLTAIVGEADLALRLGVSESPACRETLSSILANGSYLNRRIDDLMALARSEDGQLALERGPVDLAAVARKACADIASLARVNGVAVDLEAGLRPAPAWGDEARLRQCLMVLLDNAVKFSAPAQRVKVAVGHEAAHLRLCVADFGPGVAPEDLSRVFDRFYQTQDGRRRGGTGLGLAIARRIVDAHQGTIEAAPQRGGGLMISVRLPRADAAAPAKDAP